MSVTYQRPDINSFSDLANNPDYNVNAQKGTISEIEVLVQDYGNWKMNNFKRLNSF